MKTVEFRMHSGVRNDVSNERYDRDANGKYTGYLDMEASSNLDLDETGAVYRRLGTQRRITGPMHSLYASGDQAYVVINGAICSLLPDMTTLPVVSIRGRRVAYVGNAGKVYWSDNQATGELDHGRNRPWGIEVPAPISPSLIPGNIRPGRYLCTMTFERQDGEESGAPEATQIDVGLGQGIGFLSLPVSSDPDVVNKRIYISAWDGEVPMFVGNVPNAIDNAGFYDLGAQTVPVRTQFMGPPTPGQVVAYAFGRTFVANDKYLWYSQPYELGLFDYRSGYVGFDSMVRTVAPLSNGMFVGTEDKTYWLSGRDPTAWEPVQCGEYGTVLGTECILRTDLVGPGGSEVKAMGWMSKRGFCFGFDGGSMKNVTGARYVPPIAREGASLLKIRGGTPQVVTTLFT